MVKAEQKINHPPYFKGLSRILNFFDPRPILGFKKQRNKNTSPRPPRQLEDFKFSLDANISCVMQETKLFHLGPLPSKILLLYCKFHIENHAV